MEVVYSTALNLQSHACCLVHKKRARLAHKEAPWGPERERERGNLYLFVAPVSSACQFC